MTDESKELNPEMPQNAGEGSMLDLSIHPKPGTLPKPTPGASPPSTPDASILDIGSLGGETMLDASFRPKPGTPPQPTQEATLIPVPDVSIPNDDSVPGDPDFILKLRPGQGVLGYIIKENPNKDAQTTYLGAGASGIVYRAVHEGLQRQVALKFLKRNNPSPEEVELFKTEARSLANLQGRNILQVYDFSQWKGTMFMAMELLEESTAKSRMEKQPNVSSSSSLWERISKFSKKEAEQELVEPRKYPVSQKDIEYFVNTIIQVAEQLEIAHQHGILHRDIKPVNIGYRNKELNHAVLSDYGLAVLIRAEDKVPGGTPGYMAPETPEGTIDVRTDLFGLGATLYDMLTGKRVHRFEKDAALPAILYAISSYTTPTDIRLLNKKVDWNLAAIVHKAVAKEPGKRYDSAKAFYEDLKRWMDGKRVKARPITSFIIPTHRRLKKRGLLWLSAAIASGTLFGLATSLYNAKGVERLRDARVESYIADIKSSASAANAQREAANKSYDALKQRSIIEMVHGSVDLVTLTNHQKTISSVFDSYSKALKLAEEWKKDDVSPEKKSEEKIRELDILAKEFEKKNDYAVQKISAYEKILEAVESYKEKDFAKAEKALALALDRLHEADTQKELIRVQEEYSMYQKQRTMQGVRDVAVNVRAYRHVCRACFMDEIDVFSGSEEDILPGKGTEWKKTMTGIETLLETPEDAILRKIPLDAKTYRDLIEQAKADAQEAFYSEQSILKNKDVKRAIDMKRNKFAEDKYVADLTEKYKGGKMDDEEYRARMRLPPPSQREQFMEKLNNEFKKGIIPKPLYDKLRSEK